MIQKNYNASVDTTNRMIDAQNKRYHKYNIQRLEAKPIFCTYYSIDRGSTTLSSGTKQVLDKIGTDSPIRFNKIRNVPLYGFKALNREIMKTEYKGIKLDVDNESITIGGIEPCENDYLAVNMGTALFLFEVTKVDPVNIVDKVQNKIMYTLKKSCTGPTDELMVRLEKQVISDNTYIVDNIGSDKVTIMNMTEIETIKRFSTVFIKMNNLYLRKFYDNINNVLTCNHPTEENIVLYSPLLVEFQSKAQCILFECSNNYSQALLLCHETMSPHGYADSMYADLINEESNKIGNFVYFDIKEFEANGRYMSFYSDIAPYRTFSQLNQFMENGKTVHYLDYNDRMREYDPRKITLNPEHESISIIKTLCTGDSLACLDILEKYRIDAYSIEDYLFIPIVLNLLKMIIEGIQRDPRYLSE